MSSAKIFNNGSSMDRLHVVFFPYMAYGHMLPTSDIAELFASHGVKTTIITTPHNVHVFEKGVEKSKQMGNEISLKVVKLPTLEVGLPDGFEHAGKVTSGEECFKFFNAISMLQQPLEQILEESRPTCLVSDWLLPWTLEVTAKFNIPRIVFHGVSFFSLCVSLTMRFHQPFKTALSDSEPLIVPNLPHEVKFTRMQVPPYEQEDVETNFYFDLINQAVEADSASYGVLVNSFYELEPEYARHYREVFKRKAWHIGPALLCSRKEMDQIPREMRTAVDEVDCLKWLDRKKPNSVIYACFGSIAKIATAQLHEIAMGLEAAGHEFIWVVRKAENDEESEKWLPDGFERRMEGKGLIIRGWAPQVMILNHEAVGAFVTHCGWNSVLEGVCAGLPMVTWPASNEQFYNEKLVTEVLRIGIPVGAQQWSLLTVDGIKREAIENAVKSVMVGDEAEEMAERAKALKEKAREAVKEGGSSYYDLLSMMEELVSYSPEKKQENKTE